MIDFVVCGIEHSGTTLISDLFRQVDKVDAGFEVGVLLGKTPREFVGMAPFSQNILKGWGITQAQLTACCDTDEFQVFYERLIQSSSILGANIEHSFDKTPRYLHHLDACMAKVDLPFICSYKDPRAIVHSDFARAKQEAFGPWFANYFPLKLRYMRVLYGQYRQAVDSGATRACFVSLEDLCLDTRRTCERLFAHVGYQFKVDYVLLRKLRYNNTRADAVSSRIAFEYKDAFSEAIQKTIQREFAEFEDWFYD